MGAERAVGNRAVAAIPRDIGNAGGIVDAVITLRIPVMPITDSARSRSLIPLEADH